MWWGTAIEAPDPGALARFYSELLGWPIGHEEPGTAILAPPGGTSYLVFQQATDYRPPAWPDPERPQQFHLDLTVDEAHLDDAERRVLALGATRHDLQPGDNWRVYLDPVGHPFCFCWD